MKRKCLRLKISAGKHKSKQTRDFFLELRKRIDSCLKHTLPQDYGVQSWDIPNKI